MHPRLRARIPFGLRVGLRRLPATLRWLAQPRPVRGRLVDHPHVQAERRSPLRRQGTEYEPSVQAAKEHNVRRAAQLLDGLLIPAGGRVSWHAVIGPPVRARGFVPGPELHEDALAMGGGGGLCQVANLLAWLAVHSGLDLVERHRHGLDLFPDSQRTVPFGLGATVFFPHRDLVLRNPFDQPVLLSLSVVDGWLEGQLRFVQDPGLSFTVVETHHAFRRRPDGVWRENRLSRRSARGTEFLWENRARCAYPVPAEDLGDP